MLPLNYQIQLSGLAAGAVWFWWVKDKWMEELCLVGIAGEALLTALIRYQDTGLEAWRVLAFGVVVVAAPWLKRLQGKVGLMADKRERRALAKLFGEPSIADMFLRDPRLERLRARHAKLNDLDMAGSGVGSDVRGGVRRGADGRASTGDEP